MAKHHDFPSRKNNPKRIELTGDFAGFWFTLNFRVADLNAMQLANARMARSDDPEALQQHNTAINRAMFDDWISDHNFVNPEDEPYPVGAGLFEAIDIALFNAVTTAFKAYMEGATVPNA